MPKTLLEKAKAFPSRHGERSRIPSTEIEDVAVAWLRGEISFGQANAVTGAKGSSLYGLLAVALKRAVRRGRIKIKVSSTSR